MRGMIVLYFWARLIELSSFAQGCWMVKLGWTGLVGCAGVKVR